MSQEIITYSGDALTPELKWQILSFLRVQWPEGFRGKLRLRDWISRPAFHPLHFILVEQSIVISHAEVLWQYLDHAGETYRVYGLSGVFTFPDHQGQGYGKRVVDTATDYIHSVDDADVAMLWCEPYTRPFYMKSGWQFVEGARTMITDEYGAVYQSYEALMMLFLSEKGRRNQAVFSNKAIYFGDTTW